VTVVVVLGSGSEPAKPEITLGAPARHHAKVGTWDRASSQRRLGALRPMSPSSQLSVNTHQGQTRRRCAIGSFVHSVTCPQLLIRAGQGPTTGSMCHGFQVGEACPIAQANWYEHGSLDSRHERYVVRQLQQVRNRQGKDDLAIYRDALIPAVEHLFAPIASKHGRTSQSPALSQLTRQEKRHLTPV
jgi:hypothetical protein